MTVTKWINLYYKIQLLWFALTAVMAYMGSSEEMVLKMTAFSLIIPMLLFISGLIYLKNGKGGEEVK